MFPGLAATTASKHFLESNKMQKGHMKQIKQGTRTIKTKDDTPTHIPDLGNKHHNVYTRGFATTKNVCKLTKLANFLSILNEDTSTSWWLLNLM